MTEGEVFVACLACGGIGFIAGFSACLAWLCSALWRALWGLE